MEFKYEILREEIKSLQAVRSKLQQKIQDLEDELKKVKEDAEQSKANKVRFNIHYAVSCLFTFLCLHLHHTQCSKIRKKVQLQKYKKTLFAFSKMAKNQFVHQKKV